MDFTYQVDEEDIENEGFQDAKNGKSIEDCPYDIGTLERQKWVIGWGDYYYQ